MSDTSPENAPNNAIEWFARLRTLPGPTRSEREAFARWMAADPGNAAEFAAVERLWVESGDDAARLAAVESAALDDLLARMDRPPRRWNLPRLPSLGDLIAHPLVTHPVVALCLLLVVAGYWWRHPHMVENLMATESTAVGERRSIVLSDGSTLDLDADGAVDIAFTPAERRITLLRGRLHVAVAHDPGRPLRVITDVGTARAVGTMFEVDRRAGNTVVTVTEGRVALSEPAGDGSVEATAGRRMRLTAAGVTALSPVDPAGAAAWRRGRLVFRDAPLSEVIATIARNHPTPVVVLADTRDLDARLISGSLPADAPDRALEALRDAFGLRIDRVPGLAVLIR